MQNTGNQNWSIKKSSDDRTVACAYQVKRIIREKRTWIRKNPEILGYCGRENRSEMETLCRGKRLRRPKCKNWFLMMNLRWNPQFCNDL